MINLTCCTSAALHLRSGELYSSSNCHRSYRSSLDAVDTVIGRGGLGNQWRHYYRDRRADRGSRRGQRGAGMGSRPKLVKSARGECGRHLRQASAESRKAAPQSRGQAEVTGRRWASASGCLRGLCHRRAPFTDGEKPCGQRLCSGPIIAPLADARARLRRPSRRAHCFCYRLPHLRHPLLFSPSHH